MTYVFRSSETDPFRRGREFGAIHKDQVRDTLRSYQALFAALAGAPVALDDLGAEALAAIGQHAPAYKAEIEGIAAGAEIAPALLGALNARTEILARLKLRSRGECSAIVHADYGAGKPVALQNWDWYEGLVDRWVIWEIPHADGSMTTTFTEFGILGKIGINSHGVGLLFTILSHEADGGAFGLPVHLAARQALDQGMHLNRAMQTLAAAKVSASSSMTLVSDEAGTASAVSTELYPGGAGFVFPDEKGWLVRTNHFLTERPHQSDLSIRAFPDTLLRHHVLTRQLARLGKPALPDIIKCMRCGVGGDGAVFATPNADQPDEPQFVTVATIQLDFERRSLNILEKA